MLDGTWLMQRISTESRQTFIAGGWETIQRDDVFTVVVVDDPGPCEMKLPAVNDIGQVVYEPPKRYHAVLLRGALFYFDHEWLQHSELVEDVV